MADTVRFDQIESCHPLSVNGVSSSVHQYLNYSKKLQLRLAEFNTNVSSVIKESCSGIDNICNKVRQCLCEMDMPHSNKSAYIMDEVTETEYEILEERSKSGEEISHEVDETFGDISVIGTLEDEKIKKKLTPEKKPSHLTPFFTEINCEKESVSNKADSCRKKVLNKTIYSLMNKDDCPVQEETKADSTTSVKNVDNAIKTLCDNFELMNSLVENIDQEIKRFSKTAVDYKEPKIIQENKESPNSVNNTDVDTISNTKSIKRLSKSKSRQKSVQVYSNDCISDSEVDFMELNNQNSSSLLIPDVYRKRAFTNLYQKLIAQVEANDSLLFFQTLMKRQRRYEKKTQKKCISQARLDTPNTPNVIQSGTNKSIANKPNTIDLPKKEELSRKYTGSLWFSPKVILKEKGGSKNCSKNSSRKDAHNKKVNCRRVQSRSINSGSDYPICGQRKSKTMTVTDSEKRLSKFHNLNNVGKRTCSLECNCKVVVENNLPPSPSTKCHLQWLRAKTTYAPQRKLEFLDILDDLTTKDLLPLRSEYPRKDNRQPRELDYKDITDTYLYKLLYGRQGTKTAWKQLLEPSTTCSRKDCSLCKRSSSRSTNSKKIKDCGEDSKEEYDSYQNYSRRDVIKKLSQYLFDPDRSDSDEQCKQSVIVMPVHVYYDNFKPNDPPTRLQNFRKPSVDLLRRKVSTTENRGLKKSDCPGPRSTKNMKVIYDSLPRNPEAPSIMSIPRPQVTPSKHLAFSARSNSTDQHSIKKVASKSYSPRGFASYLQEFKNINRQPTNLKYEENAELYNKIQMGIEKIKKEVYGRKNNTANTTRKLFANKYGKSVGQKLISFVEHQEPEISKPVKTVAPKSKSIPVSSEKKKITNPFRGPNYCKQNPRNSIMPVPRNDPVQNNIRKAINVIESQMVDILCENSNSVEAFNVMEREITNVLSLMKCNKRNLEAIPSTSSASKDNEEVNINGDMVDAQLEEDYNSFAVISDQLVDRLQRILDTGSSIPSTPTDGTAVQLLRREKDDIKRKQKLTSLKRRNKVNVISPSTSASMDENTIQRRPNSKRGEKTEPKPKMSIKVSRQRKEEVTEISKNIGDQNVTHAVAENCTSQEQEKLVSEDQILKNSAGDFVKKESYTQYDVFYDAQTITEITESAVSDDSDKQQTMENALAELVPTCNEQECTDPQNASPTSTDVETFINDEITKVIDSIITLGRESLENIQKEDLKSTTFGKENVSSTYETPQSDSVGTETNLIKVIVETNNEVESSSMAAAEDKSELVECLEEIKLQSIDVVEVNVKVVEAASPLKLQSVDTEINAESLELEDLAEATNKDAKPEPPETVIIDKPDYVQQPEVINKVTFPESPRIKTVSQDTHLEPKSGPKASVKPPTVNEKNANFTEQVHRIIRRVEDIYSQLDDIQNSDSTESIPVFKDAAKVADVQSEIFLTPFMQAVKHTRNNVKDCNTTEEIQKSPSYYNVMSFLDTMYNIQKELPYEIHVARLCSYSYICYEAIVFYQVEMWYEAKHSSMNDKPSCLKKSVDDIKQIKSKKVSFVDLNKEEKSTQVSLCPFHKVKVIQISSQQFPPIDKSSEEELSVTFPILNKGDCIRQTTKDESKVDHNRNFKGIENFNVSQELDASKSHCCAHLHKHENVRTCNKLNKMHCPVHCVREETSEIKKNRNANENAQQTDGCEKTKRLHASKIDDKSTQVFCQMHQVENSVIGTANDVHKRNEHSTDTPENVENNPDDSKSTDKDIIDNSLADPFYDFTNNKAMAEKIHEVYEKTKGIETQPKIVVFREIVEGPHLLEPLKTLNNVNDIELYKRRLEKRREMRLRRKSSTELVRCKVSKPPDNENVVLLKSFYAIIYILMFTALSMDYRCL